MKVTVNMKERGKSLHIDGFGFNGTMGYIMDLIEEDNWESIVIEPGPVQKDLSKAEKA